MAVPTVRGRFIWHELMTTDVESASRFYTKVVGWKRQEWDQNPSYHMFATDGVPMAGFMLLPEDVQRTGVPPHWLCYIGTPDVDATAAQAQDLGAKVLKSPTDIPVVGRFSVIQDPQGAVFCAFTPNHPPQGDAKPTLGDFSWHGLSTKDWPAALHFYHRLFGWEKAGSMEMGPDMGTYQMFGWNGIPIGGMFNTPASMPAPPHWLPYAMVPDSKKAAEVTRTAGGKVINGPQEVPGGDWIAVGMDPSGGVFAVHSLKPAVTASAPVKVAATPASPKKKAAAPKKKKAAAKKKPAKKKAAAKKKPAKKKAAAKKKPAKKKAAAKKKPAKKKAAAKKKPAKEKAAAKKKPAKKKAAAKKKPAKKKAAAKKKPAKKKAAAKKKPAKKKAAAKKKSAKKKPAKKKARARK